MRIDVQRAFEKDISQVRNKNLALKVKKVITELESCATLSKNKES